MKSESGAMNFFGHETRIVLTGSMEGSDEFYNEHPEYEIKRSIPKMLSLSTLFQTMKKKPKLSIMILRLEMFLHLSIKLPAMLLLLIE